MLLIGLTLTTVASAAGPRQRRVFTIGESDISGKISQPQALYLLQQSAVETTFPEPKDQPLDRIWDTLYLDAFEP
jgi:hypothetical protein